MRICYIFGFSILGSIGAIAGAAFLTSIPLSVATAISVITHEIPQEVGDFAILLENGYSRNKALVLNTLSAA